MLDADQSPIYRPVSAFGLYWGRLCFEWFPGRFPSEIQAEIDRLPEGFVAEMIESYSYAKAFAANQADPKGSQSTPMRMAALEIEYELAAERMAERASE